jgi:hypothetical protein
MRKVFRMGIALSDVNPKLSDDGFRPNTGNLVETPFDYYQTCIAVCGT